MTSATLVSARIVPSTPTAKMGDATKVEYVELQSPRPFARQLAELCKTLGMLMPMFKGRRMNTYVPRDRVWEITAIVLADPTVPGIENLNLTKKYLTWEQGVESAMHETLSRLCYLHRHRLPAGSPFLAFGGRNEQGLVMITTGDRNNMPLQVKQLEDMEIKAWEREEKLMQQREELDYFQGTVHLQGYEMETLHTAVNTMEQVLIGKDATIATLNQTIVQRDQVVVERDQTIVDMAAQIAALQAQQNPPPNNGNNDDENDDDDDSDDDDADNGGGGNNDDGGGSDDGGSNDNDGGDAAGAFVEGSDEEDPEEVEFEDSSEEDSGEVYTPPPWHAPGAKRWRMDARTYCNLFIK